MPLPVDPRLLNHIRLRFPIHVNRPAGLCLLGHSQAPAALSASHPGIDCMARTHDLLPKSAEPADPVTAPTNSPCADDPHIALRWRYRDATVSRPSSLDRPRRACFQRPLAHGLHERTTGESPHEVPVWLDLDRGTVSVLPLTTSSSGLLIILPSAIKKSFCPLLRRIIGCGAT